MPSFRGGLTNQQVCQFVSYLRSMTGQLAKGVSSSLSTSAHAAPRA
jgi:hypothetical protein